MFELKSTYLNSAYFGPTPVRSREFVEKSLQRTMDPSGLTIDEWMKIPDRIRNQLAKLMGAPSDNIAIGSSVSDFVSHVANGMNLTPDDEVLLMKDDFPSMILPWMVLSETRGFKIRILPVSTFQDPDRFKGEITSKTKFAGCSHVMFNTGLQLPVAELGKIARAHDVLFLADISQSFGAMRLKADVIKNVDILVGVAYKWLLGPFGSALAYFSNEALRKVQRTQGSWTASPRTHGGDLLDYTTETLPGARKFDRGQAASFLITSALEGSLDLLTEVGLEKIEAHNLRLAEQFAQNLPKSYEKAAATYAIVCIKPSNVDIAQLRESLSRNEIDVSVRQGWVRVSFHFFNTPKDVERVLKFLPT